MVLSYRDDDGDGFVDGTTARAEALQMFSAAGAAGPWKRDVASSVDAGRKTVTGLTPHFSFFALFVPCAADLSAVRVYPVPYKPNGSNADEGVPFRAGDPKSGIIFDNLPDAVEIKIYALTGRLVARFSSASSSGKLQWDVKNEAGRDVASGLYFAVVSSPGHKSVTKRILIIR